VTAGFEFRPDGPHSPEYTRQLGEALAESVRVLNYATRDGAPGLEFPSDVYSLLGWLYTAAERLPQLLDQLAAFLADQARNADLADSGRNPDLSPETLALTGAQHLRDAAMLLASVTVDLHGAQNAIAGLYVNDPEGDGDEH
jgi:hypothetical protein